MTQDNERDEAELQRLLSAIDRNLPLPDAPSMEELRQRTLAEFTQSASASSNSVDPLSRQSKQSIPKDRRFSMFHLFVRSSLALSAAVALFAVWLDPLAQKVAGGSMPFAKVMEELRGASTLHLQLQKEGQTSEILVRIPGLVRKQDHPQRYQIAAGSRWWKVDEAENTVKEGDSPWFLSHDKQIDLLKLLEIGVQDATPLLVARPFQRTNYSGHDCFAYRVELAATSGRVRIEAFADAVTRQLVGIRARDAGVEGEDQPPLAELRLVAVNQPVGDEQFAVANSLTEDGRIGKITEAQGVVVLRPMVSTRWSPICREALLRPGDWVRSELRGANAVKISLASEVELTLGPGSLIECISPSQARLHQGQVQVKVGAEVAAGAKSGQPARFTLLAPRRGDRSFKSGNKQLVRVDRDEELVDVPHTPVWLAGFEGTTSNESLGSLVVNLPDGRNESLTVGTHKVSVEIRDQIARTTIEETFVNHTPTRLEGVFQFPLPHDASISGFGMWIGNELVEADVVEKQRAREIFETILREKRDPGLLEWMGGNIFKARVFPIEPNSEKRIKIVYTQVLPLRANRYRYSYGLRSELLRTSPLRELSLNVTVNSAIPLKSVSCPTHPVRTLQTAHAAQVEFAAQEYTPNRDFEVVLEIDERQTDVVAIPHRRGNDGYFLVQFTPPGPEGNWQRELLPDSKPLNVVLLCDTSASMDSEKRRQQAEFVSAVLLSLGSGDRFQLACADVGTVWFSAEPLLANADNAEKAREFLDERVSLGWTDLDRAFADVFKKAPADAHVFYVGDGIVSAGSTDPAAFVQRLRALARECEKTAGSGRRVLHSIGVGNSRESVALKGIAMTTGGSSRLITQEITPQVVASELLTEIMQPGIQDLNIEFRGLKVAAVYPEQIPNLAAGTQHILVGRYLPEGKDQSGEIVITGTRGDQKVKYVAKINLKDADTGNSFIPRLWAREHLDQLLAQGQSRQIQQEIIALSEEFHIITPYTSLLVLESDADRERFKVNRHYEMRDGEQFFAEGRSKANFELLQAQMRRAGNWRIGLRRQILRELNELGRDSRALQQQLQYARAPYLGPNGWYDNSPLSSSMSYAMPLGGMGGGLGGEFDFDIDGDFPAATSSLGDLRKGKFAMDDTPQLLQSLREEELSLGLAEPQAADSEVDLKALSDSTKFDERGDFQNGFEEFQVLNGRFEDAVGFPVLGKKLRFESKRKSETVRWGFGRGYQYPWGLPPQGMSGYAQVHPNDASWLNTLFPALDAIPLVPRAVPSTEGWSPEAIELSKTLSRKDALRQFDGGYEIVRTVDQLDPVWNRRSSRNTDVVHYSSTGWLVKNLHWNQQTIINYCVNGERGVYSSSLLLGRVRQAADSDLGPDIIGLQDGSVSALHEQYADRIARVEPVDKDRVRLVLSIKDSTYSEHLLIDTNRHVLVKREWYSGDQTTSTEIPSDFVEIGGSWWPRKIVRLDDSNRIIAETTFAIQGITKHNFSERLDEELNRRASVQFIHLPFVRLSVARQNIADGKTNFDNHLAMILQATRLQQWDQIGSHIDAIEKQAPDKPGVKWLRTLLLVASRRNEQALDRLRTEAGQLIAKPQLDEVFLAELILGQARTIASIQELAQIVRELKPLYERQPDSAQAMVQWMSWMASCEEGQGNQEEVLRFKKAIAEATPWNVESQLDYARRLSMNANIGAADAWLRKELNRPIQRPPYEDEALRTGIADLYRSQNRWADLLAFTTEWIGKNPISQSYQSGYAQHLAALILNDQVEQAYSLTQEWIDASRVEEKLKPDQQARLDIAINFALGNTYTIHYQRMDERWNRPLGDWVRFQVNRATQLDLVSRVFTNYYFQQSDTADRLRGEFFTLLQSDVATLPTEVVTNLVNWTMSGRMETAVPISGRRQFDATEIPLPLWREIAASLHERWRKATVKIEKQQLSESLNFIYSSRFRNELWLPFLRERIDSASPDLKPVYISTLFEALLVTDWTDAIEQEAFARLRQLSNATAEKDRLVVEIPALYRLVDAMLKNRLQASERLLSDQGGLDKLTRKELAAKKQQIRQVASSELADRLRSESAKGDGALSKWFSMEQAWIDAGQSRNLQEVKQVCWTILGATPAKPTSEDETASDDVASLVNQSRNPLRLNDIEKVLDGVLQHRALTTVLKLSLLKSATAADKDRILAFLDAGIKQGQAFAQSSQKGIQGLDVYDASRIWRNTKFSTLIAWDRGSDLETELRKWIRDDVSTGPWRQSLARLLAEKGKLDEAIQLFESCQKDNLLSAGDFKQLSDWYLVTDRQADYQRSRIEAYRAIPEPQLNQLAYLLTQRSQQQGESAVALDEDSLLALSVLLEKSSRPEQYLWQLRQVYANSRDHRILKMLPDSLMGRSPQQIYAFLRQLNESLLYEIRNESTADEILSRIKTLREQERTITDLRALDLFEALIERKSAEVLNQATSHIEASVNALRRAFERKWGDGELQMMAAFLHSLGGMPAPLKMEQLRQLRELQRLATPLSREHLEITSELCHLIGSTYRQLDEGILELSIEVREYSNVHEGRWPHLDNEALNRLVSLYEQAGRYLEAETILKKYLAVPEHVEQQKWLTNRLMPVYNQALEHDGATSLGSQRNNLFEPIYKFVIQRTSESSDENERYNLVSQLTTTFEIAHRHNLPQTADIVRGFAFDVMPGLLRRQVSRYRDTVVAPLRNLTEICGQKDAIRYVVERMEQYPSRMEISWENSWQTLSQELAVRRQAVGASDLDDRILNLVLRELRRDLKTNDHRNQSMFYRRDQLFWNERAKEFAKTAEAVLAESRTSGRLSQSVASYFWNGLVEPDRAIEILLIAHQQSLLDAAAQQELINWMHSRKRYAESIPLLESLIALHPEQMELRVLLMLAYFHSERPQQLSELIQQTHDYFHQLGRWTEQNAAAFGNGCLGCNQNELAIGYLNEAVAMRQRANHGTHLNDGTLSEYYGILAKAFSGLGRTKEAVDAASASLVCWGPTTQQRANQLQLLTDVLRASKDLDDYVKHLDSEAARTGQESGILRKAIGDVYVERMEFAKAITQLRIAKDMQSGDTSIHRSLINCYDAVNDRVAATTLLLQMIDLRRSDLKLYQELASRFENQESEAERAATSIIEASPNEAENHAAMAELRQKQDRWNDAIWHWEQVAELRRTEPNGLLKLAEAQLHQEQWDHARTTILKLRKTDWPARFTNIQFEASALESRIPK